MRPSRYTDYLHSAIAKAAADEPAIEAATTFAEEGITDPPYGTVMTFRSGARIYWQTVFGSPDKTDDLSQPEEIIEGDAPPPPETARPRLSADGRVPIADAEAWLVHVLLSQGSREIRRAYPRSRPPEPSIYNQTSYGMAVDFHSGRSAYTVPLYTLAPGTDPAPNQRHQVLEQI